MLVLFIGDNYGMGVQSVSIQTVGSSVQKCGIITKGGSGLVKMVVQIGDVVTY